MFRIFIFRKNLVLASAEFQERLDSAVLKSKDEFNFDGHQGWRLSLDEEYNRVIRDDFLYEQVSHIQGLR
jgi:hypothetical protein